MVIQGMLGARVMSDCERYLGLPMATGKSKANTFKDHQERTSKRVIGRKEKYISKASGSVDKNSSSSNLNIFYEPLLVAKKPKQHNKLHVSQILVGPNQE